MVALQMPLNILYIVPYVPDLVRVRPFHLIRNLTELGHQVTVLTLWSEDREKEALEPLRTIASDVISMHLPKWQSYLNCLLAIPTRQPLQSVYCYQPDLEASMMKILLDRVDGKVYDVVHIEHLRGARYGLSIRKNQVQESALRRPSIPIVWDSVDSISHLFRQARIASRQLIRRVLLEIELKRTEKMEGYLIECFDRVLVTSKADRRALLALASQYTDPDRVMVLPNGVDLDYFSPPRDEQREENSIVISGKMSYHANASMVIFMLQEIMPMIWEKRPETKIYVVGKDPPGEIRALGQRPGVEITGTVPEIRPYLQRAAVAVSPILYGAGIQNKVLEAMACATPVVSSRQAIHALEVEPGRDLLVADNAREFAEMTLGLLEDDHKRRMIGTAGRKYVERYHQWRNTALDLESVYLDVIKSFINY